MSRQSPFGHPFLLGFDEIEQALDRVAKAGGDGYPPYNIERLARTAHDPERLSITLAVAGFTRDQLEVTLEESQLVSPGSSVDDKTRHFLHRGIAARQFQRAFLLAEGMEVMGADLSNGLLSIDLVRPEPERIVRKIDIASPDKVLTAPRKEKSMNVRYQNTTPNRRLNLAELAALGLGQMAYVRPMLSDDVARLFPAGPKIEPGLQLFALLSASGEPILLTDNRDAAVANAWAHDLTTVSLH